MTSCKFCITLNPLRCFSPCKTLAVPAHLLLCLTCQHFTFWPSCKFGKFSTCYGASVAQWVEPASCFWKVAGLIPLVCILKCPWASYWTPNCSWCAGQHLAWQPPPSLYACMYVCMNYCKLFWTNHLINTLKCKYKHRVCLYLCQKNGTISVCPNDERGYMHIERREVRSQVWKTSSLLCFASHLFVQSLLSLSLVKCL